MTGRRVLVIEDEPGMRGFLRDVLAGEGIEVDEAADGDEGLDKAQANDYDLVFTDLRMPGVSGTALVRALRGLSDPPEVVVLTAYGTVADAVEAMKAGAHDFLEKPVSGPDQVRVVARKALERRALIEENERLRRARGPVTPDVVVVDPRMREVLDRVARVARTDATVLILGESGVGKEVVAREVHRLRFGDSGAPFVAINCAAVPENLLESELFGHEKGAFTSAVARKIGVMEAASGGTLFLDEVGEMPAALQVKLLRVLETREFQRVGGVKTLRTDARFIAATNQDLASAVQGGRFRQDLYYRLSVFPVTVPPLRERPEDVLALARAFAARIGRDLGRGGTRLSDEAVEAIRRYDWPGNVRELRNAIERAVILAPGLDIRADDLGLPARTPPGSDRGLLARRERETILSALEEVGGNRRLAAERLGISLRTLQYRLREYGLTER